MIIALDSSYNSFRNEDDGTLLYSSLIVFPALSAMRM